jgi:citrate synthase
VQIGKADEPYTSISRASADRVEVRGHDLAGDLMGRVGFTEYFHLLLTGREPTADERFFLDLLLVAIAEHGLVPSNVAARMTLDADPTFLQGAVAAGLLGAGTVILGAAEDCARMLAAARLEVEAGEPPEAVVRAVARRYRDDGRRLPGFGHPLHRPHDPRAERILELAGARGLEGPHLVLARGLRDAVAETWERPLTLNVSLPIAAVMLDLGYAVNVVKAVPILARTASLLAHLAEEGDRPVGFLMAAKAEEAVEFRDE